MFLAGDGRCGTLVPIKDATAEAIRKNMKLPAGSPFVVIAQTEQVKKILEGGSWDVIDEPARKTIDEAAFEPGARARAVLRGVEMAQEVLRASGGATISAR